jgi:hypothetical protein
MRYPSIMPRQRLFVAGLILSLFANPVWCNTNLPFANTISQVLDLYNQDCLAVKTLYDSLGGSYTFGRYECCGWNNIECAKLQVLHLRTGAKYHIFRELRSRPNVSVPAFIDETCVFTLDKNQPTGDFKMAGISMTFKCDSASCNVTIPTIPRVTAISWKKQGLTGSVSGAALKNLTQLKVLSLSDNSIRGFIPSEIDQLKSLEGLELDGNALTGTIPTNIGSLTNLTRLALSNNILYGEIPSTIGKLTSLRNIELSGNQLSGKIPGFIYTLPKLSVLDLQKNLLSGDIFGGNTATISPLTRLLLSDNSFTGVIPASIGRQTKLVVLSVAGNQLSGVIPREVGSLVSLDTLQLSGNKLSGLVPSELGLLKKLIWLDLSSNLLSGEAPKELSHLTALRFMRLENNEFSSIPDSLFSMSSTFK